VTHDASELEKQLIVAAQSGDRRAFDEIVLRHKAVLYRFVRRYVGDADEAYDVLQNTFVAAWLALRRFDHRKPLIAWLRTIALNKCRDDGRRRGVRRRILALFAGDWASAHAPIDPSSDDAYDDGDSHYLARLDRAIAALPRQYKEPILLTLVAGLTQQQAAEQLRTSPKAIEMRIRRGKERLRQLCQREHSSGRYIGDLWWVALDESGTGGSGTS
jgi:RNA polymerase sigma-70 factor (ECF subfamily)